MPSQLAFKKLLFAAIGGVAVAAAAGAAYQYLQARALPGSDLLGISQRSGGAERPFELTPAKEAKAVADFEFEDGQGRKLSLAEFQGKVILLNLWATWCPPCRREMPALDRLHQKLGGPDFQVVALAVERGGSGAVRDFFEESGITSLGVYVDTEGHAPGALRLSGLPTTMLLNREGREIGRVVGAQAWESRSVIDFLSDRLARGSRSPRPAEP